MTNCDVSVLAYTHLDVGKEMWVFELSQHLCYRSHREGADFITFIASRSTFPPRGAADCLITALSLRDYRAQLGRQVGYGVKGTLQIVL